jgi:hypothetical protein
MGTVGMGTVGTAAGTAATAAFTTAKPTYRLHISPSPGGPPPGLELF